MEITAHPTRLAHLRIKAKSLAAEAKVVRKDEAYYRERNKSRKPHKDREGNTLTQGNPPRFGVGRDTWLSLREHRVHVLRPEARATNLARAYLRRRPYKSLEASYHEAADWDRVATLVHRFGAHRPKTKVETIKEALLAWRDTEYTPSA